MKNKTAYYGVMTALALIFSYIEALIPLPFGVPGMKLGLANLVLVILLYMQGTKAAFLVSTARICLAGFMFGNMSMILYSLAGSVCSLFGMHFLKKSQHFSIVGVSVTGGILHNLGQLVVAAAIVETCQVFYYLPFLLVSGLVTGAVIGMTALAVCRHLFPELSL